MNSPEKSIEKKPSFLEMRSLKRTVSRIFDPLSDYEPKADEKSLDFCVRPRDELRKLQTAVHEQYGYGREANRFTPRSTVNLVRTGEGIGLYYASSRFLHYRSHRFILDSDGQLHYHQEVFGADCQFAPSPPLNIDGLGEIAVNKMARTELLWLADEVGGLRSDQWVNTGRIAIKSC